MLWLKNHALPWVDSVLRHPVSFGTWGQHVVLVYGLLNWSIRIWHDDMFQNFALLAMISTSFLKSEAVQEGSGCLHVLFCVIVFWKILCLRKNLHCTCHPWSEWPWIADNSQRLLLDFIPEFLVKVHDCHMGLWSYHPFGTLLCYVDVWWINRCRTWFMICVQWFGGVVLLRVFNVENGQGSSSQ